ALDCAAQLEQAAGPAPRGCVVAACEHLLLDQGRQLLRDSRAATLQHQIDQHENKGGPARTCPCGQNCRTKGADSREFLTALGPLGWPRTCFRCPLGRLGGSPVADRLGFDGWLTERAEPMITLAGVSPSFRHGCTLREQRAGWTACHEILRRLCYRQAD